MARGCLQGVKYLMFAFNLLFWLGGCGVLGVGIWLAATQGNFATLSSSFPSLSAANLLIVTGTFVMAIGFVGCIGALKENKCLLLTFFLLLLLVFLLEATIAVLFFAYTDKIDRYAQQDLKKGLHLYGTQGNVGLTNAWSIIQTDVRHGWGSGGGGKGWSGAPCLPLPLWPAPTHCFPSSAAVVSPTTRTGLRSTMPPVCLTPAAWSSVTAVGCMRLAPGGRRPAMRR
ncbi:Hypothetical predicted protein [Marmota monax]|uniref:Tetraspanin n=1 Tax=Marmota monax TaxID=9995 RepID=A0A5E4AUZ8_MARMO|nr:Hypothetical predicted protein [Marmota monax]